MAESSLIKDDKIKAFTTQAAITTVSRLKPYFAAKQPYAPVTITRLSAWQA
jgi:hypothetical protein